MSPASQAAIALGLELRRLRNRSGKSGTAVAADVGVGQATLSRWETGESVPSVPQVEAYAASVGAAAGGYALLVELAGRALDQKTFGDQAAASGLAAIQADVADLEDAYTTLRHFQPALIPGLLQIADYARAVLRLTGRALDEDDLDRAVQGRLDRQAILADPGRRISFLITEAALRWHPAGAHPVVMRTQLHQVAGAAATMDVRLIPLAAEAPAIPAIGFVLHEDSRDGRGPLVQYDLPHKGDYATDPADVQVYRDILDRYAGTAMAGEDAFEFAEALAREHT